MSYAAQVYRVLIASPSDVDEERDIAVKIIQEWNDMNSAERQLVLLPLRWETHSAPEYGKRPQEVINRQVVDQCDLLVGIFWTRIGSPTGLAESGTLEEIEKVAKDGKLVMLYFSKANQNPDDIDLLQLQKLRDFKSKTLPNALIEHYSTHVEFRDKLAKQLGIQVKTLIAEKIDNGIEKDRNPHTDIVVNFADVLSGDNLGKEIEIEASLLEIEDYDNIPDYKPTTVTGKDKKSSEEFHLVIGSDLKGKDYYRNLIDRVVLKNKNIPIKFWLKNFGTIGARDVFIHVEFITKNSKISLLRRSEMNRGKGLLYLGNDEPVKIDKKSDNNWVAAFEIRALQPKREVTLDSALFLGADDDCQIIVNAEIYADTLSEPVSQQLLINYKARSVIVDYNDLLDKIETEDILF
ncbi:hypothetical protein [Atlantibacter hermannii]|uniref:hypothetical protein n=1 Tax=Atlantibacter hermannii TaxID=565 RepID=UPI002FF465D1